SNAQESQTGVFMPWQWAKPDGTAETQERRVGIGLITIITMAMGREVFLRECISATALSSRLTPFTSYSTTAPN
ncbi:hypothetical protein KC352_g47417, partial [Hortaea werneckii]